MAKRDGIELESEEEDVDVEMLAPKVQTLAEKSKMIEEKLEIEKDKRQHYEADIAQIESQIQTMREALSQDATNVELKQQIKSKQKKRLRKKRGLKKANIRIEELRNDSIKLVKLETTGEEPPRKRQRLQKQAENTDKETENKKLQQILLLMSQISPIHKRSIQKFAKSQNIELNEVENTQDTNISLEKEKSAQQDKPNQTQTTHGSQDTTEFKQPTNTQFDKDDEKQIDSIFQQTGVKLSAEELQKARVQLVIHKLKKDMEDTKLCPYQFEGASSETDERILEFRRKFCDWFESNSRKQGFDEKGAIEKILRFNITKSAQKKLNEDDLKTIKSKRQFLKWFDTHYPLEKLRDIKYHQVYKYSFAASLKAGSVMTGFKRLLAEMESITEGILPAKIENLSFKQTEKVDLLIAAIKRSNKEMHDLLISKTIMNDEYPQTLQQLQAVLLSIEKYLQESRRSELIADDPTKIGTRAVNAISKSEFGLDEVATTPNSGYGSRSDTYRGGARTGYWSRNVFGRSARGRGARGARARRGNRGGRGRFRSYRNRYMYGNRVYNRPEFNTNVENVNWNSQQQIRQFGSSIERFRRKTIGLQRLQIGDRAGMCALYQIPWDDNMLTNYIPKEFLGTCNKCRRWGHIGRHHDLMVDILPGLAELYATGQRKQVNLLSFEQLTQTNAFRDAVKSQAMLITGQSSNSDDTADKDKKLPYSSNKSSNIVTGTAGSGAAFLERMQSSYN